MENIKTDDMVNNEIISDDVVNDIIDNDDESDDEEIDDEGIDEEGLQIFIDAYNKLLIDKNQKEYVRIISKLINNTNILYVVSIPHIKKCLQHLLNKKLLMLIK